MTDNEITVIVGWPTQLQMEHYREVAAFAAQEAVEREREAIIAAIPGGSVVDPQWVCDMIRARKLKEKYEKEAAS